MLYVKDSNILTLRQLLQAARVARAEPPRKQDLDEWGAFELQPDNPPSGDVVQGLQTASEGVDGKWYRDYEVRSFTDEEKLQRAKQVREHLVSELTVITSNGKVFDGDENSQNRMSRAIIGMSDTDSIKWVLADDSISDVTKSELVEALYLSGQKQSELWVIPHENDTP